MKCCYDRKKEAQDEKNNEILLFLEHDDKKQLNQPLNAGNTESSNEKPKKSCLNSLLAIVGYENNTSQTTAANDNANGKITALPKDERINLNV